MIGCFQQNLKASRKMTDVDLCTMSTAAKFVYVFDQQQRTKNNTEINNKSVHSSYENPFSPRHQTWTDTIGDSGNATDANKTMLLTEVNVYGTQQQCLLIGLLIVSPVEPFRQSR